MTRQAAHYTDFTLESVFGCTGTHTHAKTHTLDLAVFVPGAVAPCMDTHGEVKIQNPTSERPHFYFDLTY